MTPLAEDEVVQSIRGLLGSRIGVSGLEDDAAVLPLPSSGSAEGSLVVSVDTVVDGVHVDLSVCSPADAGWKAVMGALSDLAAMGASPLGALVALCVPGGAGDGTLALAAMGGVAEAAGASGCPVLGGDVSASSKLALAVTVLGLVEAGEPPPVTRAGARPGDVILVTGACGASAAGLRALRGDGSAVDEPGGPLAEAYRRPVARLAEGVAARRSGATALIDVSDGLALDLHRLADASGVGFVLDDVPVAAGATLEEALGGGEDYELVIALGAPDVEMLLNAFAAAGLREPFRIGSVDPDPGRRVLRGEPLARAGWQHVVG